MLRKARFFLLRKIFLLSDIYRAGGFFVWKGTLKIRESCPALGCTRTVKVLLISHISFYPCRSFSHLASLGFWKVVPVRVCGVAVLEVTVTSFWSRRLYL